MTSPGLSTIKLPSHLKHMHHTSTAHLLGTISAPGHPSAGGGGCPAHLPCTGKSPDYQYDLWTKGRKGRGGEGRGGEVKEEKGREEKGRKAKGKKGKEIKGKDYYPHTRTNTSANACHTVVDSKCY